jgi:catechol 2,3-dioxygenase-like lactoylglutathione lyase family enzyme
VRNDGLVTPIGVDHVVLLVSDLERSLPYYRLVYGARAEGARDSGGRVWFNLDRGTRIGLQKAADGPPRFAHYAIRVAPFDRRAVTARVQELGGKVLPSPDEPDVLRFADNNGIIVELRSTPQ